MPAGRNIGDLSSAWLRTSLEYERFARRTSNVHWPASALPKRSSSIFLVALGLSASAACDRSPGAAPSAPGTLESAAPVSSAAPSPSETVVAPPVESSAELTPAKYAPIPNWTHNGSDSESGRMILRCENAFPPEDGSGKCLCEGYELNVCVDGVRSLMIDRKQCGFICKPQSHTPKQIAIRCPDGTNPETSARGCGCSGRQPFDPCAGGIAAVKLTAGECVVTCKRYQ